MFFFFGIMNDQKNLDFHQPMTCDVCGRMGQYQVFVTYMVLSIFFIPIFKWGRTYYVRTSCCGSLYQLRPEVGRAIERGESVTIQQTDLYLEQRGQAGAQNRSAGQREQGNAGAWQSHGADQTYWQASGQNRSAGAQNGAAYRQNAAGAPTRSTQQRLLEQQGKWTKVCYNCGYTTTEDFEYCPKCGKKFEYTEQK